MQRVRAGPDRALGDLGPVQPPGIGNCVLRLTPQTLSSIYLGEVTNWNDSRIKADNGTCKLPDLKITPVYRSDSSGSTWAFTNYLAAVSPAWKSKVGVATSVNWPAVSARAAPRACRASSPRRRAR